MKKKFYMVAIMALVCGSFTAKATDMQNFSTSSVTVVATSSEWDKILNEYEQYVDKYVQLYKKVKDGDMSALTEYTSLMEKAQKLSEKLENAKDDMSSAQLQRYMKITQKMAEALK